MLEVASIIKQCFWLHFSFQTSALFFSDIVKCTNNEAASNRSCKRPLSPLRQKRSYWLYRAHQLALRPFLSWGDAIRLSPASSQRPYMNHYTDCTVLSDQCFFFSSSSFVFRTEARVSVVGRIFFLRFDAYGSWVRAAFCLHMVPERWRGIQW